MINPLRKLDLLKKLLLPNCEWWKLVLTRQMFRVICLDFLEFFFLLGINNFQIFKFTIFVLELAR